MNIRKAMRIARQVAFAAARKAEMEAEFIKKNGIPYGGIVPEQKDECHEIRRAKPEEVTPTALR